MKEVIKITKKILLIFLVFVTIFCAFSPNQICLASDDFNANDYKPSAPNHSEDAKLVEIGNNIIKPIQTIGSLVSVIAIIIIGIRYMMGSIEEKAQYKELLMPYFIGAIFIFGITNVVSIIYNIAIQI